MTATGRPFSEGIVLDGCVGTVPGMGAADCKASLREPSMPFACGFISDGWASLFSSCGVTPEKDKNKIEFF